MELTDQGMCFACGQANPIGLKLDFKFVNDDYCAEFIPKAEHQGYDNIVHGGIISTLLDEAMAKLVYAKGFFAVTAQLNIRYRKPAHIGDILKISGRIINQPRKGIIDCGAEIRDIDGALIAEATGRMVNV